MSSSSSEMGSKLMKRRTDEVESQSRPLASSSSSSLTSDRDRIHEQIDTYTGRFCRRLAQESPASRFSVSYKRNLLRGAYGSPLDRVDVLGNDSDYGHTGCVPKYRQQSDSLKYIPAHCLAA